jgi:CrcB protein
MSPDTLTDRMTHEMADDFPLDPDLDVAEDLRHRPARAGAAIDPFAELPARSRLPHIDWRTVAAIGAGGCAGGIARYGIGKAWSSSPDGFPAATFFVNTTGAFILALLLVLVLEVLPPSTYLRPVIGTGFCGAYTTFSSVAVATDQLVQHGHAATAAGYVGASIAAGLAAASFGIVLGRSIAAGRRNPRED